MKNHVMDVKWYQIEEELDLNLSLKCLKSGVLEKKFKGIYQITDMVERVNTTEDDTY